jgi:hypothetical protein
LVALQAIDDPRNPLHGSTCADRWIAWGFDYWTSLQHANGAFDEAYPFEQCLAATGFTSFYLGAAFGRCRPKLDPVLAARVERALRHAADWLCTHDETHGLLSNHLGVAVAALEQSSRAFAEPRYSDRARFFLDRILLHQSTEGWMREYDGADVGYGTHGFFYLAVYWKMTGCERTREALDRCAAFLAYFIHPDGTIGGEYGSRNTEFYYPAGFEMLAGVSPASAAIAAAMRGAIRERQVCGVWSVDDFNLMPMLNNLLFASEAMDDRAPAGELPSAGAPFRKYFPQAGLWIVNAPGYYAVAGLSKGGTVSLFDKAARLMSARHSGLIATTGGRHFTTQDHTLLPTVEWSAGGNAVAFDVPWKSLGTTVFGTWLFIAFRLFSMTAGRVPAVSQWLKDTLVRVLIRRKTRAAVTHRRCLVVTAEGIDIEDDLQLPWTSGSVDAVEQFTAIHMGSAMYPDARTFRGGAGSVSWPMAARLRLRATLTRAGVSWRQEQT